MADSVPVELEGDAYSLMFLHACKHPTKAVNGLLLGTADADGVHVTTVLPLFHSSFALSPMLEAALMLVCCRFRWRLGARWRGRMQGASLVAGQPIPAFRPAGG
jgi:hypothetical protein